MSSSKPVSRILASSNSGLQPLLERAHFLQALTRILRDSLEPSLAEHITLSNLRDDTAIISADTPAWLTKIRYLAPIILQQLKQQPGLEGLRKVQFRVQPHTETAQPTQPPRRATLSSNGAQVLASAAEGIHDPELANALRRLADKSRR
jgi:hypothetical protein